jgi:uncharacterized damage-inducible protein DinB
MTIGIPGISYEVLLAYTGGETRRWFDWFEAHPAAALDVPIGEGRTATVRGMLIHIFAVELRYAQRLLGEPVTPYESLLSNSLHDIFTISGDARNKMEFYLASATSDDLNKSLTFETISMGTLKASAATIVAHYFIHGIRHWAQVATALRQAGYKDQWAHDVLFG